MRPTAEIMRPNRWIKQKPNYIKRDFDAMMHECLMKNSMPNENAIKPKKKMNETSNKIRRKILFCFYLFCARQMVTNDRR